MVFLAMRVWEAFTESSEAHLGRGASCTPITGRALGPSEFFQSGSTFTAHQHHPLAR